MKANARKFFIEQWKPFRRPWIIVIMEMVFPKLDDFVYILNGCMTFSEAIYFDIDIACHLLPLDGEDTL